jgi:DNA-binding NtrC family response regulator
MMAPQGNSGILVVDDDKDLRRVLTTILQRQGFIVNAVETGKEAIEQIANGDYKIALIDVRLQDMNGLDVICEVQKLKPEVTKIVITGYPSEEDKSKAKQFGASMYLVKPVRAEELVKIVREKWDAH